MEDVKSLVKAFLEPIFDKAVNNAKDKKAGRVQKGTFAPASVAWQSRYMSQIILQISS